MKTNLKGYIYLRDNQWFRDEQVYKMGIMSNGKSRDSTYSTGEVKRGTFVVVIEIEWCQMKKFDLVLKKHFQKLNRRFDGGTEFYDRSILKHLIPFVRSKLKCRVLSHDEINKMERKQREEVNRQNYLNHKLFKHIAKKKSKTPSVPLTPEPENLLTITEPMPNVQQQIVLNGIHAFYEKYDIGKLIWACGLGKAMLGLFIVKELGMKRVLIGVPSLQLQEQMIHEIKKIFPCSPVQRVGGGSKYETNVDGFVVTTYHSCDTLLEEDFDFKIGDEAHHLVGLSTDTGFRSFHRIRSRKTLYMTATEKVVENVKENMNVLSMDQECFGETIDTKSVCWAIEHKKITDYQVVLLKNTAQEVTHIMNTLELDPEKTELFLSCLMCIKSMEKYPDLTHVLLYTNTTQDADLSQLYMDKILSKMSFPLFNRSLHSKSKGVAEEIETFKASPRGIISCVYLFGEGFDLPKLNGVCIAGRMKSDIRITQYLLRPNRLEKGNPDKIAYILIPYLDEQWNTSSDKVTTLIRHLRHVDERIEHKIRTCIPYKSYPYSSGKTDTITENFVLKEDELVNIDLRIRIRRSIHLDSERLNEDDKHNYIRKYNFICIQIKGLFRNKDDYFQTIRRDNEFIGYFNERNRPDDYFRMKGVWVNWYHFLGIDTSMFIQTKEEWIKFYNEYVIIKEKNMLYKDIARFYYPQLPIYPEDFYPEFTTIENELRPTVHIHKKIDVLTEAELYRDLTKHSVIEKCLVKNDNETITTSDRYLRILRDILKHIPLEKIIGTTTFNVKEVPYTEKGYIWCPEFQLSIQGKDAKNTLKEIIHMCKIHKFTIEIKIRIESGRILSFRL